LTQICLRTPPTSEAEKKFLKDPEPEPELETIKEGPFHPYQGGLCPYYPILCDWTDTSKCTKQCEHNPESFMDPKIKEVFDKEPWSNYCFTCGEFIPSRNHENALEPPELVYSHIVATGYNEYRLKLSKWVIERMTGKDKGTERWFVSNAGRECL
jgi:hypothetical protein